MRSWTAGSSVDHLGGLTGSRAGFHAKAIPRRFAGDCQEQMQLAVIRDALFVSQESATAISGCCLSAGWILLIIVNSFSMFSTNRGGKPSKGILGSSCMMRLATLYLLNRKPLRSNSASSDLRIGSPGRKIVKGKRFFPSSFEYSSLENFKYISGGSRSS